MNEGSRPLHLGSTSSEPGGTEEASAEYVSRGELPDLGLNRQQMVYGRSPAAGYGENMDLPAEFKPKKSLMRTPPESTFPREFNAISAKLVDDLYFTPPQAPRMEKGWQEPASPEIETTKSQAQLYLDNMLAPSSQPKQVTERKSFKKRKAQTSPEFYTSKVNIEKAGKYMSRAFEEIYTNVSDLEGKIEEGGNKDEIKLALTTLRESLSQLARATESIKPISPPKMTCMETQTMSSKQLRDFQDIEKVRSQIKVSMTMAEAEALENIPWHKGAYKQTHLAALRPGDTTIPKVVIWDMETSTTDPLLQEIKKGVPAFDQLLREKIPAYGDVATISSTDRITVGKEELSKGARLTIIAGVDPTEATWQETQTLLNKIADILNGRQEKEAAVFLTPRADLERWRKKIEVWASLHKFKILFYSKNSNLRGEAEDGDWRTAQNKKDKKTTTILIKSSDGTTTYSEALKQVKTSVNLQELGVNPKSVSMTKGGHIKLQLTGKEDTLKNIREKIQNKIGDNIKAETPSRSIDVIVKGIEETASVADVKRAVNEVLSVDGDLTVYMPRDPGIHGTRFAIVNLPKRLAAKLLNAGKLTIGWSNCTVAENLEPQRCFRCHKYGHVARSCNSPKDQIPKCANCSEPGHKAVSCKNASVCLSCEECGHRAGRKCPLFQAELRRILNEKKQKSHHYE